MAKMSWRIALLGLVISSLSDAYFHLPQNYVYDFSACTDSTCHNGQSVGYGCISGNCTYACSDGFCSGYQSYRDVLPPLSHEFLVSPWADGAVRRGEHCTGGNCGYWGGCRDGYCGGYYDFRGCPYRDCRSGPFHGHGCRSGNCQVVCYGPNCYIVQTYGQPYGRKPKRRPRNRTLERQPPAPKPYVEIQQPPQTLENIGETFEKKDRWMLKEMSKDAVYALVRSWIKDEVFEEMKPDGKEVKFILNEFRKRNRMQMRLELWRREKKANLYMDLLCPYKRNEIYGSPYLCPPMIPYQPCPHQSCPQQQSPPPAPKPPIPPPQIPTGCPDGCPGQPPTIPPPGSAKPPAKPWTPPRSPFQCPGCPLPNPPMIPPLAPSNPQPVPWAPPQIPYGHPDGCPGQKPPIPPPAVPWAPPKVPIGCPGGCPGQKPPTIPPPGPAKPPAKPWTPGPPMIPAPPVPWAPPFGCPGCPSPNPPMLPPAPYDPSLPWVPAEVPVYCPHGCPQRKPPAQRRKDSKS